MASTEIATMVKMMEGLPHRMQEQLVEMARQYLADLEDEELWADQFARTESQLVAAAQKAGQEIEAGKAVPMDFDRL